MIHQSDTRGPLTGGRVPYMLLACLLAGVIIWRGVLPALSGPETDFPNYYTASRLVLEGADATRLYDANWFQEQMKRFGFSQQGKFSPFPPPTALVLLPVSWLTPSQAFLVLTIANILALAACVRMMKLITGLQWEKAACLTLGAGLAIINCLRFGQLYLLVALSILLSYWFARQGKAAWAGIAAGLLLSVKLFPLIVVLWFLAGRQWKSALAAALTSIAVIGLGVVLMGPEVLVTYITTILPDHLRSHYEMQDPYATSFQSWDSLLLHLFVRDAALNPNAVYDSRMVYNVMKAAILGTGWAVTLWASAGVLKSGKGSAPDLMLAIAGVAALLFAPGTATYHFLLLWLPIALVVLQPAGDTRLRSFVIAAYCAIGWIPYSWFRTFEHASGIGIVLAYPRLFALTMLFVGMILLSVRAARAGMMDNVSTAHDHGRGSDAGHPTPR